MCSFDRYLLLLDAGYLLIVRVHGAADIANRLETLGCATQVDGSLCKLRSLLKITAQFNTTLEFDTRMRGSNEISKLMCPHKRRADQVVTHCQWYCDCESESVCR